MPPRHLSLFRIFALNAMAGCIDLVYAVEGAYFVPAVYNLGLPPIYGAMLLSFSPMMSIIFQSYLGSASDRCQCWWGRRRPFVVGLTISCLIGLLLFPFTEDITSLVKEPKLHDAFLIVTVILSTFLVDFSVGSLQVPTRAYLLDVLPQQQLKAGNIIYTIYAASGAAVGFGIGAVQWSSIFTSSDNFSFQVKFVCIASFFIAVFCANVTLCSVKEKNPQTVTTTDNSESDLELNLSRFGDNELQQSRSTQTQICLPYAKTTDVMECVSMDDITISPDNRDFIMHKGENCHCLCFTNFLNSLQGNFNFVKSMSLLMFILLIAFFFVFFAIFTQLFFFTSYVAEVVYAGDVNAPENSTAYQDYSDGVMFGSLALGISAVVALFVSLLLGPITNLVGMRFMFVSSYVFVMLQSGILFVVHNRIVTLLLAPAVYIALTMMLSIPFILVSVYETKGLLLRKAMSCLKSDENLFGRACAILIIALLGGQVFALIVNGPLIEVFGTVSVMIVTCLTSFVGGVVACFVTVPPESKKKMKMLKDVQKSESSTQTDLDYNS